jgi:hypothetical protein
MLANCRGCPAGQFLDKEGFLRSPHNLTAICPVCPVGWYGGGAGCLACPRGRFGSLAGQELSSSACKDCSAGQFGMQKTLHGSTSPLSHNNHWIRAELQSEKSVCVNCPVGKFQPAPAATSCSHCMTGRAARSKGMAHCVACKHGTFAAPKKFFWWRFTGGAQCAPCPPGKFGQVQHEHVAGKDHERAVCVHCQTGKYQPRAGTKDCMSCAPGSYSDLWTNGTSCKHCEPGRFQSGSAAGSCTTCNRMSYQPAPGMTSCNQCRPGEAGDAKRLACTAFVCHAGSFGANATTCSPCAAGSFTNLGGQTSCSQCAGGKYGAAGAKKCEYCPPGHYSVVRLVDWTVAGPTTCSACPSGRYQLKYGSKHCSPCSQLKPAELEKYSARGVSFEYNDEHTTRVVTSPCTAAAVSKAAEPAAPPPEQDGAQ